MAQKETKKEQFKLPKYLMLDKGSMWFDIDGEQSSGVKLYATNKVLVGRNVDSLDVVKDEHDNKNLIDYGKINSNLNWYIDTTIIPVNKLSRIILAYKHGILVEADPSSPPESVTFKASNDFKYKDNGERVFQGSNREMYIKLQNNNFKVLRDFINNTPINESGKQNLFDLFEYEKKGYNPLNRPRFEVLELIKSRLNQFGPTISAIRVNDD